MKSPTNAYKSLQVSLRGVRRIIARTPLNDCSTDLDHLKIQSYILLAHAAFEQYLEELSMEILNESVARFNEYNSFSQCLISLIIFETVAQFDENTPRKKIRSDVVKDLSKFVNIAKKNHVSQIGKNNGIKTKDQKALLLPIGIDPEDADLVTFSSLDAFGSKRGGIAHKVKITTEETRSSVTTAVNGIFLGLKNFDEIACQTLDNKMRIKL